MGWVGGWVARVGVVTSFTRSVICPPAGISSTCFLGIGSARLSTGYVLVALLVCLHCVVCVCCISRCIVGSSALFFV